MNDDIRDEENFKEFIKKMDVRVPIIENIKYYYYNKFLVKKENGANVTYYKYNFNGKLVQEKCNQQMTLFIYDDNNNLIEESINLLDYNISQIKSMTYNIHNKITSIYVKLNGKLNYYENMYYLDNGLLHKHNINGKIEYFIYNDLGQLIKKLNKHQVTIDEYFYDEFGKLIHEKNNQSFIKIDYKYFENGKLKLKVIREDSHYVERPSTIKEYYNDKEKLIKEETFFQNLLKPFCIKNIEYDENNNVKRISKTGEKEKIINNTYIQL